ncbi:MAG: biopolymer transporter ExbD [Planctomycetota bacterium]
MIDLKCLRRRSRGQPEIIILSLIDIMMVLLVFLLSTASAGRDAGLAIERPRAVAAPAVAGDAVRIGIGAQGELSLDGRRVDRLSLRELVRQRLAGRADPSVVLVADRATPAGMLVNVMDEAWLGGARLVAIAARERHDDARAVVRGESRCSPTPRCSS